MRYYSKRIEETLSRNARLALIENLHLPLQAMSAIKEPLAAG